jgi:hypothetical protein
MKTCRACGEETDDPENIYCNNCWEIHARINNLNLKATIYFIDRLWNHLKKDFLNFLNIEGIFG